MVFEHITLVELNNIDAPENPTGESDEARESPVSPAKPRASIRRVVAIVGMSIGISVFATVLSRRIAHRTQADEDPEETHLKVAE